jgi:hypothetical protein
LKHSRLSHGRILEKKEDKREEKSKKPPKCR